MGFFLEAFQTNHYDLCEAIISLDIPRYQNQNSIQEEGVSFLKELNCYTNIQRSTKEEALQKAKAIVKLIVDKYGIRVHSILPGGETIFIEDNDATNMTGAVE